MQLKKLLAQPQFNKIRTINQHADLTTNVTTIGMMEAPDISEYVVEGQLLVTTGFHFKDNIPALLELIEVMHAKKAAAIGIRDKRYLPIIPKAVAEKADELQLPILLLPAEVGLSVLVRDLLHVVLEQQTDQLTEIINQTSSLSQLILKEKKDHDILNQIAKLLDKAVFLLNSFGEIVSFSDSGFEFKDELEASAKALDLLQLENNQMIATENRQFLFLPLKIDQYLNRRFLVIKDEIINDSEQKLLLENIVNLLSLENMKVQINEHNRITRQNNLFVTIINQNLDQETIINNLKLNRLSETEAYVAFAIEDKNAINALNHNAMLQDVALLTRWYFSKQKVDIQTVFWNFRLFILMTSSNDLEHELKNLLKFINHKKIHNHFQIGYTKNQRSLVKVEKLVLEADEALNTALNNRKQAIVQFQPKQVSDLLQLLPSHEIGVFIKSVLNPILKIKNSEERKQLLKTIEVYYAANQSISLLAKRLFIHRNTALYRLSKLEKILGVKLDNFADNEKLQLAIRLYMLKITKAN